MIVVMMNKQMPLMNFTIYDDDVVNFTSHETSWVIDNGVAIHATSRKEFFLSYTQEDFGVVKMGNDNLSKVVGKWDVFLEIENDTRLILRCWTYFKYSPKFDFYRQTWWYRFLKHLHKWPMETHKRFLGGGQR